MIKKYAIVIPDKQNGKKYLNYNSIYYNYLENNNYLEYYRKSKISYPESGTIHFTLYTLKSAEKAIKELKENGNKDIFIVNVLKKNKYFDWYLYNIKEVKKMILKSENKYKIISIFINTNFIKNHIVNIDKNNYNIYDYYKQL